MDVLLSLRSVTKKVLSRSLWVSYIWEEETASPSASLRCRCRWRPKCGVCSMQHCLKTYTVGSLEPRTLQTLLVDCSAVGVWKVLYDLILCSGGPDVDSSLN